MNASGVDVTSTQSAKTHLGHMNVSVNMDILVMAPHAQVIDLTASLPFFSDVLHYLCRNGKNDALFGCSQLEVSCEMQSSDEQTNDEMRSLDWNTQEGDKEMVVVTRTRLA